MYIKKRRNKSGSISIQLIKKLSGGKTKLIKTIGYAKNEIELELLLEKAKEEKEILEPTLFTSLKKSTTSYPFETINIDSEHLIYNGDELIFGKLFEDMGCHNVFKSIKGIKKVEDKLFYFRALVISRILYSGSKLYLIDYLEHFKQITIQKDSIYRFLDTLYQEDIKSSIEECIYTNTLKKFNNQLFITFYDVTTLYFDSESEDDFRRIGFSKEGKLARPQIQLGLFTTLEGYPLSYEVYEGNKYEGHTLIDILQKFQRKFKRDDKPIVVADRGMLTKENIAYLEDNNYKYILVARIKNLSNEIKEQIINLTFLDDGTIHTILLPNKTRLILTYSAKRAKKDKYTREKALQKIEQKLNKNITKRDLKLSYYGKYLDIDDKCSIGYSINPLKVQNDTKLDGIKGFITNDDTLEPHEVISHYQNQYAVEKAFRISKTDLKIRPIYHRLENRIKAHILISFVAYALYRKFENKIDKINISTSKKILLDAIKYITAIKTDNKILNLNPTQLQKQILDAIYLS